MKTDFRKELQKLKKEQNAARAESLAKTVRLEEELRGSERRVAELQFQAQIYEKQLEKRYSEIRGEEAEEISTPGRESHAKAAYLEEFCREGNIRSLLSKIKYLSKP